MSLIILHCRCLRLHNIYQTALFSSESESLKKNSKKTSFNNTVFRPNKSKKKASNTFIDKLRIHVKAGSGGNGFQRIGGVGGKGGDIIVKANESITLKDVKKLHPEQRFRAADGKSSGKLRILGGNGKDCVLEVPVGVCVENERGETIADLDTEDQTAVIAKGGFPGGPDNHFMGAKGESGVFSLNLKLIADIGLLGFPNAGKSTFLSAVSRAKPKVADYPFTTLRPQLGKMIYPDGRQITLADLPGLVEGAHSNVGRGHRFLKHIERTKLMLMIVDFHGFQLSQQYSPRSAAETIILLNKELELYKKELLDKPVVLAINKTDQDPKGVAINNVLKNIDNLEKVKEGMDPKFHPERLIQFDSVFAISAKERTNLEKLKDRMREVLDIVSSESDQNTGSDLMLADIYSRSLQVDPEQHPERLV